MENERLKNIKKCIEIYANNTNLTNNVPESGLRLVINGQYRNNMDKEDLELARFMIGGIGAK